MAKRSNPMAPYFVQMRNFERRLLRGALDATANNSVPHAAALLGVQEQYVTVRALLLGGVLDGDAPNEPPGNASEVWAANQRKLATRAATAAAKPKKPRGRPKGQKRAPGTLAPLPDPPVPQIALPPLTPVACDPPQTPTKFDPSTAPYVTAYTMPDDPS